MRKAEYIERYGEERYLEYRTHMRGWYARNSEGVRKSQEKWRTKNREKIRVKDRRWYANNPEKVRRANRERNRKGGKYYQKHLRDSQIGLRGERNKIRVGHGNQWRPYKHIIAPDSQIHHQWIPKTSNYTGLALVEANPHMHGFINVIEILKGKITLFTEEEIREQGEGGSAF